MTVLLTQTFLTGTTSDVAVDSELFSFFMWLLQYNVLQRLMGGNRFKLLSKTYLDCWLISTTHDSVSRLYWSISPHCGQTVAPERCDLWPLFIGRYYTVLCLSVMIWVYRLAVIEWVLIWISFFFFLLLFLKSQLVFFALSLMLAMLHLHQAAVCQCFSSASLVHVLSGTVPVALVIVQ